MSDEYAVRRDIGRVTGRTGVVWVSGGDAASFLDGLLSQNIAALQDGSGARSLLLAPNGKLRAIVWVVRQDDRIGLLGDAARIEVIEADLARFKIRVDVAIEIETEAVYDVWGPGAAEWVAATDLSGAELVAAYPMQRSSFSRFVVVGHEPDLPEVPVTVAEAIRIAEGEAVSGVDVDESTIPQEAIDVAGAVDFEKGCYLGQELVARIDSRGHVNRRLVGLVGAADSTLLVGEPLLYERKPVGAITSAAWSDLLGAPVALGLLRREVAEGSTVITDSGHAVVSPLPLV